MVECLRWGMGVRASTGPCWNAEIPREGPVNVRIGIQVDGREVKTLETEMTGKRADREDQALVLMRDAGACCTGC